MGSAAFSTLDESPVRCCIVEDLLDQGSSKEMGHDTSSEKHVTIGAAEVSWLRCGNGFPHVRPLAPWARYRRSAAARDGAQLGCAVDVAVDLAVGRVTGGRDSGQRCDRSGHADSG